MSALRSNVSLGQHPPDPHGTAPRSSEKHAVGGFPRCQLWQEVHQMAMSPAPHSWTTSQQDRRERAQRPVFETSRSDTQPWRPAPVTQILSCGGQPQSLRHSVVETSPSHSEAVTQTLSCGGQPQSLRHSAVEASPSHSDTQLIV